MQDQVLHHEAHSGRARHDHQPLAIASKVTTSEAFDVQRLPGFQVRWRTQVAAHPAQLEAHGCTFADTLLPLGCVEERQSISTFKASEVARPAPIKGRLGAIRNGHM